MPFSPLGRRGISGVIMSSPGSALGLVAAVGAGTLGSSRLSTISAAVGSTANETCWRRLGAPSALAAGMGLAGSISRRAKRLALVDLEGSVVDQDWKLLQKVCQGAPAREIGRERREEEEEDMIFDTSSRQVACHILPFSLRAVLDQAGQPAGLSDDPWLS